MFQRICKSLAVIAELKKRGWCALNQQLTRGVESLVIFISFQRQNVISWPTLNRNFTKEAEALCMSTGSSLREKTCFVVLCYCIVTVHRSPWQPLTQKALQYKGGNKARNNCIKFVYPLNKVAIFPQSVTK